MDRRQQRDGNLQAIQHGWEVYDADDQRVGTVDGVEDGYILAHKGIFFPTDLYIPASAIAPIADDRVSLNVVKSDVDDQRWDSAPAGRMAGQGHKMDTAETIEAPGEGATAGRSAEHTAPVRGAAGEQTLHLHEEELRVNKERVQAGEVRLGKAVVEEQKTVSVPVTREEVYLERQPGDRQPDDHTIGEGAGQTWDQVSSLLGQPLADAEAMGARPPRPAEHRPAAPEERLDTEARSDRDLAKAGILPGHPSLYPAPKAPPATAQPQPQPTGD